MRRVFATATVVGLCILAVTTVDASAQGFFESLFGGVKPQAAPQAQSRPVDSPYGYRTMIARSGRDADSDRGHSGNNAHDHGDRSGRYRTVCVRLCDGFYWPVSGATHRSSFYRDANICRASCGEETRLFFHAASSGDTKEMVDIGGRPYTRLATAFLYRKTTLDDCKCKPAPWAQSEMDRHRYYALNETDAERRKRVGLAAVDIAAADAPVTAIGKSGRVTKPSDPAVAARLAAETGTKIPERSDHPAVTVASAPTSDAGPAAKPATEITAAADPIERRVSGSGKQRAVADSDGRGERRQGVAQNSARRQASAHSQKTTKAGFGGMFGLGAGSQKRWPGE